MLQMSLHPVTTRLKEVFAISRGTKSTIETIVVELSDGMHTGRGECVPYPRYGESRVSVVAKLQGIKQDIEAGLTRDMLQTVLPAGATRCALDCAFWDLEAKQKGKPVWQLAGLPKPKPLATTMTLSLDAPEVMAEAAQKSDSHILKLKLGGEGDLERIAAVHAARPDAKLILDGNEGMDAAGFPVLAEHAVKLGAVLIEQPFPVEDDNALLKRPGHLSICADESVHTTADIQPLAKKYDAINIKLDKAGGFTEALAMMHEARRCGLATMVGCMVAGSISMAPALLLGQVADLIDLDGPLWLESDVEHGLVYKNGKVSPPSRKLWG